MWDHLYQYCAKILINSLGTIAHLPFVFLIMGQNVFYYILDELFNDCVRGRLDNQSSTQSH